MDFADEEGVCVTVVVLVVGVVCFKGGATDLDVEGEIVLDVGVVHVGC